MKIYKNELDTQTKEIAESLLFNGNGYIGVRNVFDEYRYEDYKSNRQVILSGFYDTFTIKYPEDYFGSAKVGEQLIPVPEGLTSEITIGKNQLNINTGDINNHERYIDVESGISERSFTYTDVDGNQTGVSIEKIVSFTRVELFSTRIKFKKLNHNLPISITTKINLSPQMNNDKNDPRVGHNDFNLQIDMCDIEEKQIVFSAPNSGCQGYMGFNMTDITSIKRINNELNIVSNLNGDEYIKTFSYSLESKKQALLCFEELLSEQCKYLNDFWRTSKVTIKAKDNLEETVNYGTYALLQSISEYSVAAKGLSGLGYEGHVFWDAEMYVFPSVLYHNKKAAKDIINFRINMIEQAIANRVHVGYSKGALFPWRTITGKECSSFFEAGMAQHHINLDIGYAICKYFDATLDVEMLQNGGWKSLIEIIEMFRGILNYRDGSFHIDMVTGPDEYSALVNDNLYTNLMLKNLIVNVIEIWKDFSAELLNTGYVLTNQYINELNKIQSEIYYKVNDKLSIVEQDRDFLNKAKWPEEFNHKQPLLLNNHPISIYRHQVSKQADAVLAIQLFDDIFDKQIILNSVEYYDKVTTHDSSLSYSNFATVYAKLGHDKTYQYFLKNARLDLDNLHHNTKDGIHTAAMGGTYQTLIDGFSGIKFQEGKIHVSNNLPAEISYLQFNIEYRNEFYKITLETDKQPMVEKVGENV